MVSFEHSDYAKYNHTALCYGEEFIILADNHIHMAKCDSNRIGVIQDKGIANVKRVDPPEEESIEEEEIFESQMEELESVHKGIMSDRKKLKNDIQRKEAECLCFRKNNNNNLSF